MSVMRGVDTFELIWERRATVVLPDGTVCDLLSVADLVKAKKTQRDKDWPMIRRLLEADYFQYRNQQPDAERVQFWLGEVRTPELLISLCGEYLNPNSEVGGEKAGQIEQHMRGSDGADSNFGEVGIFHTKILSMSGMCFLSPPQASESKSTGFRAARPNTAPPRNAAARNVAGCR
jgi:hypothetical protein